jgi:uncharacterized damage-inducible protein DinB
MLGELLARQVQMASEGSPWHGPGLLDNLAAVTAQQAAARPFATTHSIWELVLHLTGWAREVARRLDGAPKGAPPEGDWPAVTEISQPAWEKACEALRHAHRELAEKVRRFPEARWTDSVAQPAAAAGEGDASFAETIAGLLQHDAYHSGQIGLLRKALGVHSS